MISIQKKSGLAVFEGLLVEDLWEASKSLGFPCAMWQLPQTNEIRLLVSIQQGVTHVYPDLEKLPSGFLIAPFSWEENDQVLFMEGDIIITFQENGITDIKNRLGEEHPEVKKLIKTTEVYLNKRTVRKFTDGRLSGDVITHVDARERYKRTVELAIAAIANKEFKKVVLSRTKQIAFNADFKPAQAFEKLVKAYPHAFVSLVNIPDQDELWLGASPETLVRQRPGGGFSTMALAGTQRADDGNGHVIPRYDIRWGQKEIEEHALVSRFIVECFKKIRLREYIETGPKTVLAGNVYHLRTEFEVDTVALNFPELSTTMLKLLHPTSAICGEPKIQSRQFLNEVEGYDRSFYSGLLGPVQVEGRTDIFVNLRTVRLKEGVATLYAGAGITEDSIPEHEWEETELKCNTLLNVIAQDF